jgi:hypothetical protein
MSEQQLTEARAALIRIARALGCDPGRDCVPSLIAAQCELEIAKLKNAADALADLTAVERERDHWKANHDEMVARNRLFRGRPDLTPEQYAEREGIWARLQRAERENAELREKLAKTGA